MISSTSTILAVGAAGKFAGLVVPALAERGVRVRGLVRDARQGDAVRKRGAGEIAIGDLRDGASLDAALKGVDAVFYIAPAFLPDEAEIGKGMVDSAKRAGVRRFVFSSVIHPILSALGNHAQKAPVEEALLTSGMEYTFLHPTVFFQNFTEAWPKIVETGVLAEPWSVDARFSRVGRISRVSKSDRGPLGRVEGDAHGGVIQVPSGEFALERPRLVPGAQERSGSGDQNRTA